MVTDKAAAAAAEVLSGRLSFEAIIGHDLGLREK